MTITNIIFLVLGFLWLVFTFVVYIFNPWGWEFARRPKPREMARVILPKDYYNTDGEDFPKLHADITEGPAKIHAICALGATLASFCQCYGDALRKRVSEDAFSLIGVIAHPVFIASIHEEELNLYWQCSKDVLLKTVTDTKEFFEELSTLAQQNGGSNRVQLWGVNTLPHLGITVINPDNNDARIRVTPYATYSPDVRHPLLLVRRDSDRKDFQYYYDTYERLQSSSLTEQLV